MVTIYEIKSGIANTTPSTEPGFLNDVNKNIAEFLDAGNGAGVDLAKLMPGATVLNPVAAMLSKADDATAIANNLIASKYLETSIKVSGVLVGGATGGGVAAAILSWMKKTPVGIAAATVFGLASGKAGESVGEALAYELWVREAAPKLPDSVDLDPSITIDGHNYYVVTTTSDAGLPLTYVYTEVPFEYRAISGAPRYMVLGNDSMSKQVIDYVLDGIGVGSSTTLQQWSLSQGVSSYNLPQIGIGAHTSIDLSPVIVTASPIINTLDYSSRQRYIDAGMAPDGSKLGEWISGSDNDMKYIWMHDVGNVGYVRITTELQQDGGRISFEDHTDSTGFFTRLSAYETDRFGTTYRYDQVYDPSGKYTFVPSLLISDANASGGNYTIKAGETLWDVAQDKGLSANELLAENPQITNLGTVSTGQVIKVPATPAVTSTVTTTTTTTASSITQTGTANEGVAATAVANGIAIGNGVKTVSFSNGELSSTNTYASIIAAMTTGGIRPGNFSVMPNGEVTPMPSFMASNPAQNINVTVDAGINPGSYSVSPMGVIMPSIHNSTRTYVDPLILDLNNDGVQLTSYADRTVLFDIDHDGLTAGQTTLEQTGWVKANTSTGQTHNTDGIVVHDLNGNGKIDGIHETLSEFYNGAVGTDGNAGEKKYTDGFDALRSLDTGNGTVGSAGYNDNVFDNKDAAYNQLRVWVDANADGITDVGELKTLAELNITSINLAATTQSGLVNGGNEILATGTFTQNGQTKQAQAVNFVANTAGSSFTATTDGVRIDTQAGETGQTTSTYTHTGNNSATLSTATLNVKNIYGNTGNDTITGDANTNWLGGGAGADSINAGAGDDVILFDADDTSIDGGDGNDIAQVIGESGVTLNLTQSHIEAVVGGRGDDIFIGGGRSSVFITANDGNDIVIGGAANDVLSGENGEDLIDGGAGNDLMRGGRGNDQLMGGSGDDIIEGGQDDDNLNGGDGNDVLTGGQGDDQLDGGSGDDLAEFSGSYADYRVTKVTSNTYRVTDLLGRDGIDTLTNIEKLSFKDISWTDPDLAPPMPVKDILDKNSTGQVFNRNSAIQLIGKAQLLGNDIDRQSDTLHITTITDLQGGTIVGSYNATTKEWTPTLTANGEVQFIADPNYKGIMGFKYSVADADNNVTQVTDASTGQAATMKAAIYLRTPDVPTDPLIVEQWYLSEANIIPVWQDYTGKGIKIAQFEPGGEFSVGPEILDVTHPDLKPNLDASWLANPNSNISQTYSNHATMVAGVIVGARNGEGGVGVAYDAKISGHYIQGTGLTITALEHEITNALATFKNYDVVNNSWGASSNFDINVVPVGLLQTGIADAVDNGRDGLGTIIVMAGGNDRQTGGNTNTSALTGNRGVIVAGGINAVSDLGSLQIGGAPFSNPGASILVSAPASNITASSRLIEASNGSTFGSDYSATQGTSFATPIISGIVALMLEANPKLGWRDVQQILAITAKKVNDAATDTIYNTANNWNGGGMHTSHDYGFGEVDARAAVRLAETWTGSHTSLNERHLVSGEGSMNGAANLNIAIAEGASITRTLAIGAGIRTEHVTVSLDINHPNWGDLTVELISPTGTISKLIANPGTYSGNAGGEVGDGQLTFALDTTHSYGENAQGNWQLKITDRTGRGTGTLYGWKVDVYGSDFNETFNSRDNVIGEAPVISAVADNSYYFTDEFATAPGTTRTTINDTNAGKDIINASAVSTGVTINLNNASTSSIGGRTFTINGTVEHAFGGDGNDTITGNAEANRLVGGRGNDSLSGGAQLDFLDGGQGNDSLTGGADRDLFIIRPDAGSQDTIVDFSLITGGEKIILVGFDGLEDFSQVTRTQVGLDVRLDLLNGQSVLVKNVTTTSLTEQSVMVITDQKTLDRYTPYMANAFATGDANSEPGTLLPTSSGDITYYAMAGNDVVGADTNKDLLDGGDGNDTLYGDYNDITAGGDWLEGGSGVDTLLGDGGNDMLVGGSGNDGLGGNAGDDLLFGNSGDDDLLGGDGNDVLDGGAGRDYLIGEAGNDTIYIDNDLGEFDTATNTLNWGMLGGLGADTYVLKKNAGGSGGISLSGSLVSTSNFIADFDLLADKIDLSNFANVSSLSDLNISQPFIIGSTTITRIVVGTAANAPVVTLRNVPPTSLSASNFIFASTTDILGTANNDNLVGDSGGNVLDGKIGADTMTGRTGNDTYIVDNVGDKVTELAGGGYDAVQSSVTYDLTTLAENVEQLTLTGTTSINGTGNNEANRIVGNSGNNVLDGKGGSDDMVGGAGNDTYIVDAGSDRVTENANEGNDAVQSSVSWTLGKNLENLTLTGFDDVNATGNELVNTLIGNSADNILDGAQGADNLQGGSGNDTYYVDNTGDTITEIAGGGYDTVYSSINISTLNTTSAAQVEQLILAIGATQGTGNALDNVLIGNDVSNTLTGLGGADYLDGGTGVDTLLGGAGNDTYVIDVIKSGSVAVLQDTVTEAANEGTDTLQLRTNADLALSAATTLTLATNLENFNISATGSNKLNITGNGAANTLVGNAANNILLGLVGNDYLDGGLGADSMSGGTEDDTYIVDNIGDVVIESLNGGYFDSVKSSVDYILTGNVEGLTLTGITAIRGEGNILDNELHGNSVNNLLIGGTGYDYIDGGEGADTMIGGTEDDYYIVDNENDVVTEFANEGYDYVESSVTYTLSDNIEELSLLGILAINGTGNISDNNLWGNDANNELYGMNGNDALYGLGGDDYLAGGLGNDTLYAGTGNDTYYIAGYTNGEQDTIIENDSTANNLDKVKFGFVLDTYNAIGLVRENNDLIINQTSNNSEDYTFYGEILRIKNQFFGFANQVEKLEFSDGTQVNLSDYINTNGYVYRGTNNNDTIIGNELSYNIFGLEGNDSISGSARDDYITGDGGQDNLFGGLGNDDLQGGDGNDLLNGGSGSDYLKGGSGDDVYEFGRGYGADTALDNIHSDKSTIKLINIASTDANVKFERVVQPYTATGSYTLKITIDNTDSITFRQWWNEASNNANRFVQFTDTVLNLSDIESRLVVIAATSDSDTILGTNRIDNINSGGGNDKVYGLEGDDILNGGTGFDKLYGGEGDDQLFGDGSDTLDGGVGADIMNGSGDYNSFYVDNVGDQVIGMGDIYSSLDNYTMQDSSVFNRVYIQDGGARAVTGNQVDNTLIGNMQSNLLKGLSGYDRLAGGGGNDLLQGGDDADFLSVSWNAYSSVGLYGGTTGRGGASVLDGGNGGDTIYGDVNNDFLVGGAGNDNLFTAWYLPENFDYTEFYDDAGRDVIAFNKGDGNDRLVSANNSITVSVGKLTNYLDMSFSKVANDLVLKVGATDSLTFADWYKSSSGYNLKTVHNLQVIAEAVQGFNLGGADALRDNKVETFDFAGLVTQFDAEGATANWQLTDARLTAHLLSGSDTEAIGGDLAYQYGKNSTLTGMGLNNAQSVITAANFGQSAQALNDPSVWQAELVKLA